MKSKKLCLECNKPFVFSKGLCKYCWQSVYMKPLRKVSFKQEVRNKAYKIIRDQFIKQNPICQANINNQYTKCTKTATDNHHSRGKVGDLYLDISTFVALCRSCHSYIETNPEEAKVLGYSKNRL